MGRSPGRHRGFLHHFPQPVKIYKQGSRDFFYGMLSLYRFGVLLWLAYGILFDAEAVALTNAGTAIRSPRLPSLKAWSVRQESVGEELPERG